MRATHRDMVSAATAAARIVAREPKLLEVALALEARGWVCITETWYEVAGLPKG